MRYLSLLRYSPRDKSELGVKCQGIVTAIKNDQALAGDTLASEAIAMLLAAQREEHQGLRDVFNGNASLVPVPRSSPRSKDALWPSLRIAQALERHRLGSEVLVAVERHTKIRSSHTSGSNRPSVEEHMATLRNCRPINARPSQIILVDDVITKGATVWACRQVIQESLPDVDVVVFAAVSTERSDATLIGPVAIRDARIIDGPYGPWRPDTKDSDV